MQVSENFGIRIKEEEIRDLVVKYVGNLGYLIKPESIGIVPLTNGRIEFVIRQFSKI